MLLGYAAHPGSHALARALRERSAEGAVAAKTTLLGQLLDTDGLPGSGCLLAAADEVVDAQVVDLCVVGDALMREILAEIETVGANGLSQLLKGEVVLKVELCVHAMLFQQFLNLSEVERLTPAPSPT